MSDGTVAVGGVLEGAKIKVGGRVRVEEETFWSKGARAGNGEREAKRNAYYCPTLGVRVVVDRYDSRLR